MEPVRVRRWQGEHPVNEARLRELLAAENLEAYTWSNGRGDTYGPHDHKYHKVIYVVEGSITFGLPDTGEEILLHAGDRLDLPAGIVHSAVVGPGGVTCLEAHRSS